MKSLELESELECLWLEPPWTSIVETGLVKLHCDERQLQ
jgi:hypothetical protein